MTTRSFLLRLPALAALAVWPVPAQTHPNFTGTWKLHPAPDAPPDAPRDTVFVIEHKEPRFRYSATGKRGYVPFSESFEFTIDGPEPDDPSKLSIRAQWEDQTLVMRYLKSGKLVAVVRLRCSPDGRQMIREAEIGGGRKVHETYDRQ